MTEQTENIYAELMGSSEEAHVAELAMQLVKALLQEFGSGGKELFPDTGSSFDRKRIIALYDKMNGSFCTYFDNHQEKLEGEADALREKTDGMNQDVDALETEKKRLEGQYRQFMEDAKNQKFLLNESELSKQKERLDAVLERKKELEEEHRGLEADGGRIEGYKERQKEYRQQIEAGEKERECYQKINDVLCGAFVRAEGNRIVSNMEDVVRQLHELEQDVQNGTGGLDTKMKSAFADIQEMAASCNAEAEEDGRFQARFELYRKNWSRDSDFMIWLEKIDMEDEHKLDAYIGGLRNTVDAQMRLYEKILGAAVLQKEKERDSVERRQGKR